MTDLNVPRNFFDFCQAVWHNKPRPNGPFSGRLLALDPGETTGWSIWVAGRNVNSEQVASYTMESCGQLNTWDKVQHSIDPCVQNFPELLEALYHSGAPSICPLHVVMEAYRVYEWKTDSHSWSDVPTLRIIGSMETRIQDRGNITYNMQTAQQAKNFVTDELLQHWGFYERGQRHSRDSMRHALYFLLFGYK